MREWSENRDRVWYDGENHELDWLIESHDEEVIIIEQYIGMLYSILEL